MINSLKIPLKRVIQIELRMVKYDDREGKRVFEFIINLFDLRADFIAALYKIRWQIELVFNQLK
jgi:IS4 transposase